MTCDHPATLETNPEVRVRFTFPAAFNTIVLLVAAPLLKVNEAGVNVPAPVETVNVAVPLKLVSREPPFMAFMAVTVRTAPAVSVVA